MKQNIFKQTIILIFIVSGASSMLFAQDKITALQPQNKAQNVNIGILKWSGSEVETYDLYLGTEQNPPLFMQDVSGAEVKNLIFELNKAYFWKVVRKYEGKEQESSEIFSFSTLPIPLNTQKKYSYFIDKRDQKIYASIKTGDMEWMAQNLDYELPENSWYYNNSETEKTFGKLYLGTAVKENLDKLCPQGWHLPTEAEWSKLMANFGGYKTAGKAFKESSGSFWRKSNCASTNESGMTILPAGSRDKKPSFANSGKYTMFWTSTLDSKKLDVLKNIDLGFMRDNIIIESGDGAWSYSVRCIKN